MLHASISDFITMSLESKYKSGSFYIQDVAVIMKLF